MNRSISLVALIVSICVLACSSTALAAPSNSDMDVVHFPNTPVGSWECRKGTDVFQGVARGDVRVPAMGELAIVVSDEGLVDPSWLLKIGKHPVELLSFNSTDAIDKICPIIERFKELQTLKLSSTAITDSCVSHIAKLPNLVSLDISVTMITDAAMRTIGSMKTLTSLDLHKTDISVRGLRELHTPKLTYLDLDDTGMKDGVADVLLHTPSIQHLKLSRTLITDAAIPKLVRMPNMRHLEVNTLVLTDKSVPYMCQMKTLQTLDIRDTDITKKGVATLRKALPHTNIATTVR